MSNTTRKVSIFINGKAAQNSIKELTKQKRSLNKEINQLGIGTSEYNRKVKQLASVNGTLRNHRRKVAGIKSSWSKLRGNLAKYATVAGAALGAAEIVKYGKEVFDLSVKMEVLEKKAKTVFGEALPIVSAAAKKNADDMGLTTAEYRDQAAAIGDLLIPMGFQRKEAANISTGLVNLSGALSEWTGGKKNAKEVSDILSKAMLGEREQLKSLGISIQEADVKARLAEKGLSKLTGASLQQAKAAATLELITEKSADAQAAFAKNGNTLARQQAKMGAQFADIKEQLASALIPVFNRLAATVLPLVSQFAAWVKSLINAASGTNRLAPVMKVLGLILRNTWKVISGLFSVGQQFFGYLFQKARPIIKIIGEGMMTFYNSIVWVVNGISSLLGTDFKLEPINVDDFLASMDSAKSKVEETKAEIEKPIEPKIAPVKSVKQSQQHTKSRAKSDNSAQKEAAALIKRLDKLRKITQAHDEEMRLDRLSADERELEEIRLKYAKEIAEAKALELSKNQQVADAAKEQRALLEQQLQEELDVKKMEQEAKEEEEKLMAEEKLAAETETELQRLTAKYDELLALAEKYGYDTTDIKAKYAKEQAEILDKRLKDELSKEQAAFQAKMNIQQAQVSAMQSGVGIIKAIFKNNQEIQNAAFFLEKGLAAAQVIINLQKTLSAIQFKYAALPGGQALAAAESIKAKLSAGKSLAVIAATTVGKFLQKKEGGWHQAKGADDNTTYRAKYIGRPTTGMLPSHPSLVLASERGSEYFVAHEDLQNPPIANYVQMIESIKNRRIPQFAEGGFTADDKVPHINNNNSYAATAAISRLNEILGNGIYALINDDQVIEIFRKYDSLKDDAGGGVI